jgi:RNA polymerase-binding transcription factor DksA
MQAEAIEKYKQKLLVMRDHFTDEIRRLGDAVAEHERSAGDLSHVPTHPADRDSEGIETTVAMEHNEWQMLDQVNTALTQIEQGKYGLCQDCGRVIPRRRLNVIAHAVRCVPCEEKRERES